MDKQEKAQAAPQVPQVPKEKKFEFSKLIAILSILMWLIVNVFGMIMMAWTRNLSPMVYVIASIDAVMACVCGFYYTKSRAENIIKLKSLYGIDVTEIMMDESWSKKKISKSKYENDDYIDLSDSGPLYEDTSIV